MFLESRSPSPTESEIKSRSTASKESEERHDFCEQDDDEVEALRSVNYDDHKMRILWSMTIYAIYMHFAGFYGLYLAITSANWQTIIWMVAGNFFSVMGVTAGAHRLWSHRTYKAKWPLRLFLSFGFAAAFQLNLVTWVRDHRVHHKYVDTVADPYNSKRGFFFSHMGWILIERHPECLKKLEDVDLSDLYADPVVRFHKKFYTAQVLLFCFILPTIVPIYFWNESISNAYHVAAILRLGINYQQSFSVNSVGHKWGTKPYDVNIAPVENRFVEIVAYGEGFHNYHHIFPYDYSTSEYGMKYNLTTVFINLMAWIGLAYDRKVAPKSVIEARKLRTGDNNVKVPANSILPEKITSNAHK